MAFDMHTKTPGGVFFIYDGGCPICCYAARALRIREAAGPLHLIDARAEAEHPLVCEVSARGFDLDEGMVMKVGERFYHGADALHMMALLGSPVGWFNRVNGWLFRSSPLARLCYPAMRAVRNLLLRVKGVTPLGNLTR